MELRQSPIEKASFNNFILSLSPIKPLIDDPEISEIMVNSSDSIWIEKKGIMSKTDFVLNKMQVQAGIKYLSTGVGNKEVIPGTPSGIVNAAHENMRIAAVMYPTSIDGDALCIRKHSRSNFNPDDYVNQGAFSRAKIAAEIAKMSEVCFENKELENGVMMEFLAHQISEKKNFLIAGSTNSGKTSLLNMLLKFIPETQRIITIEDTEELKIVVPNRIRLLSNKAQKVTPQLLVELCLRMRPDRIIAGEVRGAEALDFIEALNTGHDGGFASLHANNGLMTLTRLESLAMRGLSNVSDGGLSLRHDIANCINYVIHFKKSSNSIMRFCSEIIEIMGVDLNGNYVTRKVF